MFLLLLFYCFIAISFKSCTVHSEQRYLDTCTLHDSILMAFVVSHSFQHKVCFCDSLSTLHDYPSEEVMLEDYLEEHPEERQLLLDGHGFAEGNAESTDDGSESDDTSPNLHDGMMSNMALSSSGVCVCDIIYSNPFHFRSLNSFVFYSDNIVLLLALDTFLFCFFFFLFYFKKWKCFYKNNWFYCFSSFYDSLSKSHICNFLIHSCFWIIWVIF